MFPCSTGKEEAQEEYDAAKARNETAGQVTSRPRDLQTAARGMEIFAVAVNVAPNSSVQFKVQAQMYSHTRVIQNVGYSLRVAFDKNDSVHSRTQSAPEP